MLAVRRGTFFITSSTRPAIIKKKKTVRRETRFAQLVTTVNLRLQLITLLTFKESYDEKHGEPTMHA